MLRIFPVTRRATFPQFGRGQVSYRIELADPTKPWERIYRVIKTTSEPSGPVTETKLFQRIQGHWFHVSEDLLTITHADRHELPQALERRLNQAAAA